MEWLAVRKETKTPPLWAEKVPQSGHDLDFTTLAAKEAIYMLRVRFQTFKLFNSDTHKYFERIFVRDDKVATIHQNRPHHSF